jgi:hypothetical protein
MSSIYIELKESGSSRKVDRVSKKGNTYEVLVSNEFDSKNRRDLEELIGYLNTELSRDGIESLNVRDRRTEDELRRLEIGKRMEVRI